MFQRSADRGLASLGLDGPSAERLLAGTLPPAEVPAAMTTVATLVRSAQGPATPEELAGESEVVAALTAAVRSAGVARAEPVARFARAPRRTPAVKVAACAVVAALSLTGVAAANGSLPGPLQRQLSRAFSWVGVSIPRSSGGGPGSHRPGGSKSPPSSAPHGAGVGSSTTATGPAGGASNGSGQPGSPTGGPGQPGPPTTVPGQPGSSGSGPGQTGSPSSGPGQTGSPSTAPGSTQPPGSVTVPTLPPTSVTLPPTSLTLPTLPRTTLPTLPKTTLPTLPKTTLP